MKQKWLKGYFEGCRVKILKTWPSLCKNVMPVILCSGAFLCLSQVLVVGSFVSSDLGIYVAVEYIYEAASGTTFAILAIIITVLVSGARQRRLYLLLMALVYMLVFSLSNSIVDQAKSDFEKLWLAKILPFSYMEGMSEKEFCFNYLQSLDDKSLKEGVDANKVCPDLYHIAQAIGTGYPENLESRFFKVNFAIDKYNIVMPLLMFIFYVAVIYAFGLLLGIGVEALFESVERSTVSCFLIGPAILFLFYEVGAYVWSVTAQ